jgi:hypothetical protein
MPMSPYRRRPIACPQCGRPTPHRRDEIDPGPFTWSAAAWLVESAANV